MCQLHDSRDCTLLHAGATRTMLFRALRRSCESTVKLTELIGLFSLCYYDPKRIHLTGTCVPHGENCLPSPCLRYRVTLASLRQTCYQSVQGISALALVPSWPILTRSNRLARHYVPRCARALRPWPRPAGRYSQDSPFPCPCQCQPRNIPSPALARVGVKSLILPLAVLSPIIPAYFADILPIVAHYPRNGTSRQK